MDTTFIYALTEPGTRTIRYFGKAGDPQERRLDHIRDAIKGEKWHVACWIRKLLAAGQRPDVHVLCEVPQDDFARFERAFIALGRQYDFNLTNVADGGECGPVLFGDKNPGFGKKQSPEVIANRVAKNTGKKRTPAQCVNIGASKTGEKHPLFGKKRPPEYVTAMRKAMTGRKYARAGSIFHGVCQQSNKKWISRITVTGERLYLGLFVNEIEAAKAYDAAARIHHVAYAKLNFP